LRKTSLRRASHRRPARVWGTRGGSRPGRAPVILRGSTVYLPRWATDAHVRHLRVKRRHGVRRMLWRQMPRSVTTRVRSVLSLDSPRCAQSRWPCHGNSTGRSNRRAAHEHGRPMRGHHRSTAALVSTAWGSSAGREACLIFVRHVETDQVVWRWVGKGFGQIRPSRIGTGAHLWCRRRFRRRRDDDVVEKRNVADTGVADRRRAAGKRTPRTAKEMEISISSHGYPAPDCLPIQCHDK